jgi:hypothetical protein
MADLATKIELYCKANGTEAIFEKNVFIMDNGDGKDSFIKTWSVDGLTKPTDEQLASYETAGNTVEANNKIRATRKLAYGDIADQLDDIYHNGVDEWKKTIKAVKDKYPKE